MIKGIYHAAAGMLPRMNQQETVGNNLANVNTSGFKADKRYFRTALNNHLLQGGEHGQPVKLGDKEVSLVTDFSQGTFAETRNVLDVAINGEGFFCIETGDSVSYSRNGNFAVNGEGELVNTSGHRVLGQEGVIRISSANVVIRAEGAVVVDGKTVANLKIADFEQPYELSRNGWGYFVPTTPQDPTDAAGYELRQGFLENSNVDPIVEMLEMIELNRNYESCQKAIQAQDDTLRLAVNEMAK
ncbi:MAG: flagellar basal-body rod protein FlgF [Calditrichaeota bacterium]|nr:flagellar basal-body rod protein FlgF [Calditrichota bacterium]